MAIGNGYNTGSADTGFYQNQLKNLLTNPGSFNGSPGFQFALNQALGAVGAQNSGIRGSGNALAALSDRATGMAMQDYGNQVDRLARLSGQEQNYDLGLGGLNNTAQSNANQFALGKEQNANVAQRNANDMFLGQQQNANAAQRNFWDYQLGQGQNANAAQRNQFDYQLGLGQNANAAQRNAMDFGLGMYDAGNRFQLGQEQNANTAQNNWWNYALGNQQNTNQYNLGMYNAQTNRAAQQAGAQNASNNTLLDWTKFGYQLNPAQRVAGVPGTFGGGWPGVG